MKPQIKRSDIEEILRLHDVSEPVALVGIRGYYLNSLGKKGVNDRGIYDDAIVLITPRRFDTFQANTDPSVFRRGIATMNPGVHYYHKGKHKNRYWALRLVGDQVPVTRDGQAGESIGVALNIHKGGVRTTGSEGCQTIQPKDWDDFIEIVYDEMDHFGLKQIPYVLVDEQARRMQPTSTPNDQPSVAEATDVSMEPTPPAAPASSPSVDGGASVGNAVDQFVAFIPQIDTAKRWLKSLFALFNLGAGASYAAGLPQWIVVAFVALAVLIVVAGVVVFVRYHRDVFAYVGRMNELRAKPDHANPILSAAMEPKEGAR